MITFLPYPDFAESFKSLDYKRLGKQKVEAIQILNVLTDEQLSIKFKNHPAFMMWKGYELALMMYHDVCILEWLIRGYKNSTPFKYYGNSNGFAVGSTKGYPEMPWWMGNEDFHRSHRARLIAKMPEHYKPLFPNDEGFNGGKYFWPVMTNKTFRVI